MYFLASLGCPRTSNINMHVQNMKDREDNSLTCLRVGLKNQDITKSLLEANLVTSACNLLFYFVRIYMMSFCDKKDLLTPITVFPCHHFLVFLMGLLLLLL